MLVSIITAVPAKARPDRMAPEVRVMLATARMFPLKAVPVPIVAELPTAARLSRAKKRGRSGQTTPLRLVLRNGISTSYRYLPPLRPGLPGVPPSSSFELSSSPWLEFP